MDGTLQAAYINRAWVDDKKASQQPSYRPHKGVKDVGQAIRLGPPATDLYVLAARLHALAAERERQAKAPRILPLAPPDCWGNAIRSWLLLAHYEPHWMPPMLDYVTKALECGEDPTRFRTATFKTFNDSEPEFRALLERPFPPAIKSEAIRLIDLKDVVTPYTR
jgi:hypothetical protein